MVLLKHQTGLEMNMDFRLQAELILVFHLLKRIRTIETIVFFLTMVDQFVSYGGSLTRFYMHFQASGRVIKKWGEYPLLIFSKIISRVIYIVALIFPGSAAVFPDIYVFTRVFIYVALQGRE